MPTATKNFLIFLSCLLKNPTLKIYLEGKYRNDLNWIFLVVLAHIPRHTTPHLPIPYHGERFHSVPFRSVHSFLIITLPIGVRLCVLYTYPVLDILATCTVLCRESAFIFYSTAAVLFVCLGAGVNADACATFHATSNFVAFPHDYSHFLSFSLTLPPLLIHSRCFTVFLCASMLRSPPWHPSTIHPTVSQSL